MLSRLVQTPETRCIKGERNQNFSLIMYGGKGKAATVCIYSTYLLTWLRVKQGVSGEIHRFYLVLKRESKHTVIECKEGVHAHKMRACVLVVNNR